MGFNREYITENLLAGKVGVMPTDTIYGIVASVKYPNSIERIYDIKGRENNKPFVILIGDISQLDSLGIKYTAAQKIAFEEVWPGPVSVVLPCNAPGRVYLHRGMRSLAVRLPEPEWLRSILRVTGPIVATSANRQGQQPGSQISQIKIELPDLDFYVSGKSGQHPSQIIKVDLDGNATRLR